MTFSGIFLKLGGVNVDNERLRLPRKAIRVEGCLDVIQAAPQHQNKIRLLQYHVGMAFRDHPKTTAVQAMVERQKVGHRPGKRDRQVFGFDQLAKVVRLSCTFHAEAGDDHRSFGFPQRFHYIADAGLEPRLEFRFIRLPVIL